MPIGFFLLFFFYERTETLSPLKVVAAPDFTVAAGQTVSLKCCAFPMPTFVNWSWQHLENLTWQTVGGSRQLTLTEPKQSGRYRCIAKMWLNELVSHNLTVSVIAMQPTVSENLGTAAFVLALLALIITITILAWLYWQRFGSTQTTSSTAAKSFPGPEKAPKGSFPQAECDGDVYMNYTSTNQNYTDLDPTNMTADNVYSSLS